MGGGARWENHGVKITPFCFIGKFVILFHKNLVENAVVVKLRKLLLCFIMQEYY